MTHGAVFKQIFHMHKQCRCREIYLMSGQDRVVHIKGNRIEQINIGWLSLIRNHLIKDRKFSFEPSANNFLNFFIVSWLLSRKLVAWKCQDFKSWRWRPLGSFSYTNSHHDKYSWQISFFSFFVQVFTLILVLVVQYIQLFVICLCQTTSQVN